MRSLCSRSGCSAGATTTFTFDGTRRIVWLDTLADGTPRAGDLCSRHARALVLPHGWSLHDLRPATEPAAISPAAISPAATEPAPEPASVAAGPEPALVPPAAWDASAASDSWAPRFDPQDDLDGLLDAKTPLLARAFRNARAV